MSLKNPVCALFLTCALGGPAAAQDDAPEPEAACGEAQAYQRYRRSFHFSIERGAEGFEYRCTLRKNKYRQQDPEAFREECQAFVNEYIDILNRCEAAGLSEFILDRSQGQESKRLLKYKGFIKPG